MERKLTGSASSSCLRLCLCAKKRHDVHRLLGAPGILLYWHEIHATKSSQENYLAHLDELSFCWRATMIFASIDEADVSA